MKILFLANRIPYPPYRGDKLKIFNLAKRLSRKHELHLVTFTQTEEDKQYKQELEKYFKTVRLIHLPKWKSAASCLTGLWNNTPFQVLYFHSAAMQALVDEVVSKEQFDAIHVQHLRMSPYLAGHKNLPRILDLPDAFSLYWERRKTIKRGLLTRIFENNEQKRVLKYEQVLKQYNRSLVCSQEDLDYLKETQHVNNIYLLPNGVDLDTFRARNHDYSHNNTILFTGNMDYAPNVDAVGYFTEEILPLIKQKLPEVQFVIAGQRPIKKVTDLANDYIKVTGFVKDLAEMYDSASVVVAPLRFGAGTQNKVLEAMAMGVPVVCSNIGFKGLGIDSGQGAIMQTDAQAFANSAIELLQSEARRREVGQRGMQVIKARFDWDAIAALLETYCEKVAEEVQTSTNKKTSIPQE